MIGEARKLMIFTIGILLLALHPTTAQPPPFHIVWNSPWPTNCPYDYKKTVPTNAISKFNIGTNNNTAFNGHMVTTMYNNPDHMTLGKWPCVLKNGTEINGGVPQLGNLTLHLNQVRLDIVTQLPDPGFDGYAVIDWEVWVPSFEILQLYAGYRTYYNRSMALANGNYTRASTTWNTHSMAFMVETLKVVQQLRPLAKLGYYGMVQCTFNHVTKQCDPKFTAVNDQWKELWLASSALYPELYATCTFSGTPSACRKNSSLPIKIAARLSEAKRIQQLYTKSTATPYIGFTWYALDDGKCTKSVGHCPLVKNKHDMNAEFGLAKKGGASGMIVWGSSGDVRNMDDCVGLGKYINDTLGPMLLNV